MRRLYSPCLLSASSAWGSCTEYAWLPQDTILRETQIMHEMRHPNVMPLYCSFVHGEQLWMIMPHVAGGSLFNIMQSSFPQVHAPEATRRHAPFTSEGPSPCSTQFPLPDEGSLRATWKRMKGLALRCWWQGRLLQGPFLHEVGSGDHLTESRQRL